jgi:secondary thiamine-phosphate synthase enzyme
MKTRFHTRIFFGSHPTFGFKFFDIQISYRSMNEYTLQTQSHTDFINIDHLIDLYLQSTGMDNGILTLFIPHTTAGITINENADPDVTSDMEQALDQIIPWDGPYRHMEGNTAAHVKASLMGFSTQLIIQNGRPCKGTWQSVYFCEFDGPRSRKIWIKGIA